MFEILVLLYDTVRIEWRACCICAKWMSNFFSNFTASMRFFERNVPEEEMCIVVEDWMQQVRQTMQPLINVCTSR